MSVHSNGNFEPFEIWEYLNARSRVGIKVKKVKNETELDFMRPQLQFNLELIEVLSRWPTFYKLKSVLALILFYFYFLAIKILINFQVLQLSFQVAVEIIVDYQLWLTLFVFVGIFR